MNKTSRYLIALTIITVSLAMCGLLLYNRFVAPKNTTNQSLLCYKAFHYPAFANNNSEILKYGFLDISLNELISSDFRYVYTPQCKDCQKQIQYWGEDNFTYLKDDIHFIDCDVLKR